MQHEFDISFSLFIRHREALSGKITIAGGNPRALLEEGTRGMNNCRNVQGLVLFCGSQVAKMQASADGNGLGPFLPPRPTRAIPTLGERAIVTFSQPIRELAIVFGSIALNFLTLMAVLPVNFCHLLAILGVEDIPVILPVGFLSRLTLLPLKPTRSFGIFAPEMIEPLSRIVSIVRISISII
jgi:hypothetical protein